MPNRRQIKDAMQAIHALTGFEPDASTSAGEQEQLLHFAYEAIMESLPQLQREKQLAKMRKP